MAFSSCLCVLLVAILSCLPTSKAHNITSQSSYLISDYYGQTTFAFPSNQGLDVQPYFQNFPVKPLVKFDVKSTTNVNFFLTNCASTFWFLGSGSSYYVTASPGTYRCFMVTTSSVSSNVTVTQVVS